ncbi:hypothetical protein [Chromobacterium vaccinii]|uniref:hypothetical protein n=1 Tax=Chromobacterium vaccinii TaxID=1108595 RepID=UPI0006182936|nr:hypothetical protein [Chromobacterium vaccinii]
MQEREEERSSKRELELSERLAVLEAQFKVGRERAAEVENARTMRLDIVQDLIRSMWRALLLIVLLCAAAHYGLAFFQLRIEREAKAESRAASEQAANNARDAKTAGVAGSMEPQIAGKDGLILLRLAVESYPEGGGAPKKGAIPLSGLVSLIDKFAAAGAIMAKDASALKSELLTHAVEGGKEIMVEAAKKLIDKFLDDKKDEPLVKGAAGQLMVQVNQFCGGASTKSHPKPAPPTPKPRDLCGK